MPRVQLLSKINFTTDYSSHWPEKFESCFSVIWFSHWNQRASSAGVPEEGLTRTTFLIKKKKKKPKQTNPGLERLDGKSPIISFGYILERATSIVIFPFYLKLFK